MPAEDILPPEERGKSREKKEKPPRSNPGHINGRGVYECQLCGEEFWLTKGDEKALEEYNKHRKEEHEEELYDHKKPLQK